MPCYLVSADVLAQGKFSPRNFFPILTLLPFPRKLRLLLVRLRPGIDDRLLRILRRKVRPSALQMPIVIVTASSATKPPPMKKSGEACLKTQIFGLRLRLRPSQQQVPVTGVNPETLRLQADRRRLRASGQAAAVQAAAVQTAAVQAAMELVIGTVIEHKALVVHTAVSFGLAAAMGFGLAAAMGFGLAAAKNRPAANSVSVARRRSCASRICLPRKNPKSSEKGMTKNSLICISPLRTA